MHREESDQLQPCADCGAAVDSAQSIYGFGAEGVLCFACSERRGGSYDANQDRWTREPDLSGLLPPEE